MKFTKMLGLLAVAVTALMAFVGTASAAELTSPKGTKLLNGAVIKATSTDTKLHGSVTIACNHSTVEGSITNTGGKNASGETETVKGNITSLTFTECGKDTVNVINKGTLEVHSIGGNQGTVTSSGATVTVQVHRTIIFPHISITTHCEYTTNNTHIGTLTGSDLNGHTTATLHAKALLKQHPTDGACGEDAEWTGTYTVTSPDHLYVD